MADSSKHNGRQKLRRLVQPESLNCSCLIEFMVHLSIIDSNCRNFKLVLETRDVETMTTLFIHERAINQNGTSSVYTAGVSMVLGFDNHHGQRITTSIKELR